MYYNVIRGDKSMAKKRKKKLKINYQKLVAVFLLIIMLLSFGASLIMQF